MSRDISITNGVIDEEILKRCGRAMGINTLLNRRNSNRQLDECKKEMNLDGAVATKGYWQRMLIWKKCFPLAVLILEEFEGSAY